MGFLKIPPGLGAQIQADFPAFYEWLLYLETFISTKFSTKGDMKALTSGKGVILTNAAGTVTKRAKLNDAGDGWLFEDP